MWQVWREMFSRWRYIGAAVVVALVAFALAVWLRNFNLIVASFTSSLFTFSDSVILLVQLLGGSITNATPLAAILVPLVSLLFGINAALLLYTFQKRKQLPSTKTSATAVGAFLAAIFGAGCASCGTFLLGAVLSSVGATGLLALLPLGGQELLIVSSALLAGSIVLLSRSIQSKAVCVPAELKSKSSV